MKLGHLSLLIFLMSSSMMSFAANKKPRHTSSQNRLPASHHNGMHRSQSAVDCTRQGESVYIEINSTPDSSPRARDHHKITMPQLKKPAKTTPKKTWWQRNRINVVFGTQLVTVGLLGATVLYMKSAVNGAVAQVKTEIAPVTQAANDIIAVANLFQNITGATKP